MKKQVWNIARPISLQDMIGGSRPWYCPKCNYHSAYHRAGYPCPHCGHLRMKEKP